MRATLSSTILAGGVRTSPSPEPQRRLRQQQRRAAGARSPRPGGGRGCGPGGGELPGADWQRASDARAYWTPGGASGRGPGAATRVRRGPFWVRTLARAFARGLLRLQTMEVSRKDLVSEDREPVRVLCSLQVPLKVGVPRRLSLLPGLLVPEKVCL